MARFKALWDSVARTKWQPAQKRVLEAQTETYAICLSTTPPQSRCQLGAFGPASVAFFLLSSPPESLLQLEPEHIEQHQRRKAIEHGSAKQPPHTYPVINVVPQSLGKRVCGHFLRGTVSHSTPALRDSFGRETDGQFRVWPGNNILG